jgi:hypothetical protein
MDLAFRSVASSAEANIFQIGYGGTRGRGRIGSEAGFEFPSIHEEGSPLKQTDAASGIGLILHIVRNPNSKQRKCRRRCATKSTALLCLVQ